MNEALQRFIESVKEARPETRIDVCDHLESGERRDFQQIRAGHNHYFYLCPACYGELVVQILTNLKAH